MVGYSVMLVKLPAVAYAKKYESQLQRGRCGAAGRGGYRRPGTLRFQGKGCNGSLAPRPDLQLIASPRTDPGSPDLPRFGSYTFPRQTTGGGFEDGSGDDTTSCPASPQSPGRRPSVFNIFCIWFELKERPADSYMRKYADGPFGKFKHCTNNIANNFWIANAYLQEVRLGVPGLVSLRMATLYNRFDRHNVDSCQQKRRGGGVLPPYQKETEEFDFGEILKHLACFASSASEDSPDQQTVSEVYQDIEYLTDLLCRANYRPSPAESEERPLHDICERVGSIKEIVKDIMQSTSEARSLRRVEEDQSETHRAYQQLAVELGCLSTYLNICCEKHKSADYPGAIPDLPTKASLTVWTDSERLIDSLVEEHRIPRECIRFMRFSHSLTDPACNGDQYLMGLFAHRSAIVDYLKLLNNFEDGAEKNVFGFNRATAAAVKSDLLRWVLLAEPVDRRTQQSLLAPSRVVF